MSLAHSIGRLIRRAVTGFPDHYVTRLGIVVAIPDPPDEEKGTDRFRPRYAVDVQILAPDGEPDTSWPLLEGLALPAHGGIYAFPEAGTIVRIGYDFGQPSYPYIAAVLSEGQPAPALKPGERLWYHSPDAFQRFDAKGNITIQTNGELREDSSLRTVEADETAETHGKLTTAVSRDWTQTVEGRLLQTILGAWVQQIAGDVRVAMLGGMDTTIAGDESRLVGGNLETIVGQAITSKAVAGDVLLQALAGSATLQSAVKSSVVSALVDLGLSASEALVLGDTFLLVFNAHTHSSAGVGPPNVLMIPGVDTSVTVKTT